MEVSFRPMTSALAQTTESRRAVEVSAVDGASRPEGPQTIPPGQAQTAAAVSASLVTAAEQSDRTGSAWSATSRDPEPRTLKPWGIAMLPDEAAQRAAAERARAADEKAKEAVAAETRAEAVSAKAEADVRDARKEEADLQTTAAPAMPSMAQAVYAATGANPAPEYSTAISSKG